MSKMKMSNSNKDTVTELKEQVNEKMETLTIEIPNYSELTEEGKKIVDNYISIINLDNEETIDNIAKNELKRIYMKLGILKGAIETCYTRIENTITEVKEFIAQNNESGKESFFNLLKRPLLIALGKLKSNSNEVEDNGRTCNLTDIDIILEKLESIRIELRINAGKLEAISQNSEEQFIDIQYQIIALQEVLNRLQKDKIKQEQVLERTFFKGCQDVALTSIERSLLQKIDYCRGISRNARINFITSRLLAERNEQIASEYEEYLKILLPESKTITTISEMIDTYNEFAHIMNERLKTEAEYSKEVIAMAQNAGRPTNEAFTELLDDFRSKLSIELGGNIEQESKEDNNEGTIEENMEK